MWIRIIQTFAMIRTRFNGESNAGSLTLCEDFVRIVLVGRFSLELFQLTRAMRSAIDRRFGKPGGHVDICGGKIFELGETFQRGPVDREAVDRPAFLWYRP